MSILIYAESADGKLKKKKLKKLDRYLPEHIQVEHFFHLKKLKKRNIVKNVKT